MILMSGKDIQETDPRISEISMTIFAGVEAFFREKIANSEGVRLEVLRNSSIRNANFFLNIIITGALNELYPQDPENPQIIHPMATEDYLYSQIYKRTRKSLLAGNVWDNDRPIIITQNHPGIVKLFSHQLAEKLNAVLDTIGNDSNTKLGFIHQFLADIDKIKSGFFAGKDHDLADEYGIVSIDFIWEKIFNRVIASLSGHQTDQIDSVEL